MLDIMPSKKLVEHEWQTHGTCSGLAPDAYFAKARAAYDEVKIPSDYKDPAGAFTTDVAAVEQAFSSANPSLRADAIAVQCKGRFLQEVRFCLDPQLKPRACGRDITNACGASVTVRPVK